MIQFLFDNKEITLRLSQVGDATDWSEITINEARDLVKLAKSNLPKTVMRMWELQYKEPTAMIETEYNKLQESITDEQEIKVLPQFYGECLLLMSDIGEDALEKMNRLERKIMFQRFIEVPLKGLLFNPDYNAKEINSFKFKGETYYLPAQANGFDGITVPMGEDTTAIEFTECADIELRAKQMEGGRFESAAILISILCRPKKNGKREKYNQKVCLERAKIFGDLPLDTAFDVFFCCIERLNTSEPSTLISLKGAVESRANGQTSTGGVIPLFK